MSKETDRDHTGEQDLWQELEILGFRLLREGERRRNRDLSDAAFILLGIDNGDARRKAYNAMQRAFKAVRGDGQSNRVRREARRLHFVADQALQRGDASKRVAELLVHALQSCPMLLAEAEKAPVFGSGSWESQFDEAVVRVTPKIATFVRNRNGYEDGEAAKSIVRAFLSAMGWGSASRRQELFRMRQK